MNLERIAQELHYKAVRSSGAGGQHVNKVATKVELHFHVDNSQGLTVEEKTRLKLKLKNRISKEGILQLQCDEARSQFKNKGLVTARFFDLLKKALAVAKKRKATKPSKRSVEKRLENKKKAAQKKANRKRPSLD